MRTLFIKSSQIVVVAVALLAALTKPSALLAQDSTSKAKTTMPADSAGATTQVRVHVVDTLGAPIDRAEVMLADSVRNKILMSTFADTNGIAVFARVPRGAKYTVITRKIGYGAVVLSPIVTEGKASVKVNIEMEPVTPLNDIVVTGKMDPAYMTNDKELGKHPIENMRLGEALQRYNRYMLGDRYKCPADRNRPYIQQFYVNGVRWTGLAYNPLREVFASDISFVRYYDCWAKDSRLANSLVIVLKPGVEFPAKNYGEAQRDPTR